MMPSSTALLTAAAAASLLLGPALATGSSHPDPAISPAENLNSDGPVHWHQAQAAAAPAGHQASHETDKGEDEDEDEDEAGFEPTLTSTPLGWQPELRRSGEDGEARGAVLLRRETSAAPTIYGVSIWLIMAWLALLYFMYKTGSMF